MALLLTNCMAALSSGTRFVRPALTALLLALCCATTTPARAAVMNADFDGDGVVDHVVVAPAPASRLAAMPASARLRLWLHNGHVRFTAFDRHFGFSFRARRPQTTKRLSTRKKASDRPPVRPRRHRNRREGVSRARHIGHDIHSRGSSSGQQATSADSLWLNSGPREQTARPSRLLFPAASDRLPSSHWSARRASRAPPLSSSL
jgi:hypothetical protein